jgi:choloylglycine hydrolase
VRTINRIAFVSLAAIAAMLGSQGPAKACTGIRLQAADGSVVYARTMEFGIDLHSAAIIIPRQFALTGTTSSGRPGLEWKSKYALVGLNGEGLTLIADGVNEAGLAAGIFLFPGYAQYQQVAADDEGKSIAPWEVVTWALTNFATVDEVREGLSGIKVGNVEFAAWKAVPPVHYVIHDASGKSLVVEYVGGKLNLYDNQIGVITNAPEFGWHLTNLRNYISLSPKNVLTSTVDGERFSPLGQGSGMYGLPGDFTPPSRFVRAVALSQSAIPGDNGEEAVRQAFHVLDSFDIPSGTVRSASAADNTPLDDTQWTSASDTRNRSFYFHSHGNRRIRRIDLMRAELNATEVVTIPLDDQEDEKNLTPQRAAE